MHQFGLSWAVAGGALSTTVLAAPQPAPAFHMEPGVTRRVEVDDRISVTYPGPQVSHWKVYWRALADLPFIEVVRTSGTYTVDGQAERPLRKVTESGPMGRPLWVLDAACDQPSVSATMRDSATVELCEARLVPGAPDKPVPPLSKEETALFTAVTRTYDFADPKLRDWIAGHGLARRPAEPDLDFARRVAMFMCNNVRYDLAHTDSWIASAVSGRMFGECCQQAILATAVLRASSIPARTVCCRWVARNGPIHDPGGHVWNVFFAEGIGWVPFDVTCGNPDNRGEKWFGYYNPGLLPRMLDFDFVLPEGKDGAGVSTFALDAFPANYSSGPATLDPPTTGWGGSVRILE